MSFAYVTEAPPMGPPVDGGGWWDLLAGLPGVADLTWLWGALPFAWGLLLLALVVHEFHRHDALRSNLHQPVPRI